MNWIAACIRNKLIVYISIVALCMAGLFALYSRPLTPFPQISFPAIFIHISYPGANAQVVEKQVTNEVVSRLQSVDNVQYINAFTQAGSANIEINLNSGSAIDLIQAEMDVNQAISSAHLPSSVPQPHIHLESGWANLITFVVSSKQLSLFDIDNFTQSILQPQFSTYPGVLVRAHDLDPVVKIQLNPDKIANYGLDTDTIASVINKNYSSAPLGSLYIAKQQYLLGTIGDYDSINKLKSLIVGYKQSNNDTNLVDALHASSQGIPILLKDVATVTFEPRDVADQPFVSFNGETARQIQIFTKSAANPFLISSEAKKFVNNIKNSLPADLKITPVFDMSTVMQASIDEVSETILIAVVLVLLVALVFLGRLKTTLIPIITVPVCLLGAVCCFAVLGYTINLLTLLAMVIAVGLVVDDAIVVVENITRYVEMGKDRYTAVVEGTASIAKTIVGITLTLLAVYLPMTFISGNIALLLRPFALSLASAVLISGAVALTLTPIMALYFVDDTEHNNYQKWFDDKLHRFVDRYQFLLQKIFKMPVVSMMIIIVLIIAGSYLAAGLPKMVFPVDPDGSAHINIQGSSSDDTETIKQKVERFKQFYTDSHVKYYSVEIANDFDTGILAGKISIQYKDKYLTQVKQFSDAINHYIKKNNIQNTYAKAHAFLNWGDDDYDVSYYIYGSDLTKINDIADALTKTMQKSSVFTAAINTINEPEKQLAFDINAVKAQRVGITRSQILNLLSSMYGGSQMSNYFSISGLSVPIVMQLNNEDMQNPQSYQKLRIHSSVTNQDYPLADFVTIKTVAKPIQIITYNGLPAVEIQSKLAPGKDIAAGIDYVNQLLHTDYPQLQYAYVDNAKRYLESNNQTTIIVLLGILCIYFLLTILFKNLLDPLIIMLTVPFTVIGGALSLYLIGGSLNIFSVLGLITLIGLITKHGVLIVQFANVEMQQGKDAITAVLHATRYRFRPIIMTTLAMVLGALPLMVSHDIMYVSRQNLAITIIGGLLIGTLFSLFIVPLVYVLVKRNQPANKPI